MLTISGDLMKLTPNKQGYKVEFTREQVEEMTRNLALLAGAPMDYNYSEVIIWERSNNLTRLETIKFPRREGVVLQRIVTTHGRGAYMFNTKPDDYVLSKGIRVLIAAQRLVYGYDPDEPSEGMAAIRA